MPQVMPISFITWTMCSPLVTVLILDGDKKSPLKKTNGGGDKCCSLLITAMNRAAPPQCASLLDSVILYTSLKWTIFKAFFRDTAAIVNDRKDFVAE
mmetsp:Transcript_45947/g.73590  ORF Transcript_45947/g.73590 Transcript_45947/m.73590 type:complete len:97 (-) Transcript_45947:4-294(-)